MSLVWAAECKKCGRMAVIRPSVSFGDKIDLVTPSEKIPRECPHCGFKNDFLGGDLKEVAAAVVSGPPPSNLE
jgi:hypothetical protein